MNYTFIFIQIIFHCIPQTYANVENTSDNPFLICIFSFLLFVGSLWLRMLICPVSSGGVEYTDSISAEEWDPQGISCIWH